MSIKKKDITELNNLVSIISTLGTKYKPEVNKSLICFKSVRSIRREKQSKQLQCWDHQERRAILKAGTHRDT